MRREVKATWYQSRLKEDSDKPALPNPDDLIASAVAGSLTKALSQELERSQLTAQKIEARASLLFEDVNRITKLRGIHVALKANVPGAYRAVFIAAANRAQASCSVSRILSTNINITAKLEGAMDQDEDVPDIVIYTSAFCQVCGRTRSLLREKQINFREIDLEEEPEETISNLKKRTGVMGVPQIFVGDQFIGNYEDLLRLDAEHQLDKLLANWKQQTHQRKAA